MDDPDARLRIQIGFKFRALQKRIGITNSYATHNQVEVMMLSDRVVVMQAGPVLQIGTPEQIYRRSHSRAVATFFG